MRHKGVNTALRFDTDLPVARLCETFNVPDLYHDLTMPVEDRLCAAFGTPRSLIQHRSTFREG